MSACVLGSQIPIDQGIAFEGMNELPASPTPLPSSSRSPVAALRHSQIPRVVQTLAARTTLCEPITTRIQTYQNRYTELDYI